MAEQIPPASKPAPPLEEIRTRVLAFILRKFRPRLQDAEDAVQTAMVKYLACRGKVKIEEPVSWCCKIAGHFIIDQIRILRRAGQSVELKREDNPTGNDDEPLSWLIRSEDEQKIRDCIEKLLSKKTLYEVLRLRFYDGLRNKEVASLLEITEAAAANRYVVGLRTVFQCFERRF